MSEGITKKHFWTNFIIRFFKPKLSNFFVTPSELYLKNKYVKAKVFPCLDPLGNIQIQVNIPFFQGMIKTLILVNKC